MPEDASGGRGGGVEMESPSTAATVSPVSSPLQPQESQIMSDSELDDGLDEDDEDNELDEDMSPSGEVEWVVKPPDGGWGWVVVAASFACNFIVDGIIFTFGMFLGHISEAFGEPKSKVALIGSLLSGFYLMAGPFVSALANRFGFRLVTILGAGVGCAAFVASSLFATGVEVLYVTYGVLGGIGFGLVYVPAVITTGFYFEKWRALATGIAVCGSGIGTFLMAPLCTYLIDEFGWRGALMIQAGIVLNCAIFGAMFRPLMPVPVMVYPTEEEDDKFDENNQSDQPMRRRVVSECAKDKAHGANLPLLQRIKIARDEMRSAESSYSVADPLNHINEATENHINNASHDHLAAENNNKHSGAMPINHQERKLSTQSVNVGRVLLENEGGGVLEDLTEEERGEDASLVVNQTRSTVLASCSTPHLKAVLEEKISGSARVEKKGGSTMALSRPTGRRRSRIRTTSESGWSFTGERGKKTGGAANSTTAEPAAGTGPRPFDRSDIFFSASLLRLPQYTSQSSIGYHASVTKLPTKDGEDGMDDGHGNGSIKFKPIPGEEDEAEKKKGNFCSLLCPAPALRTLSRMLDISLLQSPTFLLLAVSGFLTMMGFFVPFMFLSERAVLLGMDSSLAVWLISAIGITNTIGRVLCGMVSSLFPKANAVLLNNMALTIAGIATLAAPLSVSTEYQFVYSSVFGLTIACFASLRSILVVDLLGLDKLTNAFGLLLLFQGLAATVGAPIAGSFMELTGSYDASFYLSGSLILVSGIMCYPINIVNQWEKRKAKDEAGRINRVGKGGGVQV